MFFTHTHGRAGHWQLFGKALMSQEAIRVLMIVNHFPPDKNPSGRLMSRLAEGLRDEGFAVDVLTSFPHYEGFTIDPAYRGRWSVHESVGDDVVTRLWVLASGRKQNMLHRLANYVSFAVMSTVAGLSRRRKYDVVLANSGSFFTGISATVLRAFRGTPFLYNVQDIYPDVPVKAGQLGNGFAIRALERIARFMYDRAAIVTVISREQKNVLLRKGVSAGKLHVVPNFVDTSFIRPLPKQNPFAQRHGLADKFVIGYAGNLGLVYDFGPLLACARHLASRPDVLFLIVGDGVRKEEIRAHAAKLGNVRFMDFQAEKDLPFLRAAIDVHVSPYKKAAAQDSLPSKIYEIMACGRPAVVAADRNSELRQLVDETACGLSVDPEDADSLYHALVTLYDDPVLRARMAERGRAAAVERFSRDRAVASYAQLLRGAANIDRARCTHE